MASCFEIFVLKDTGIGYELRKGGYAWERKFCKIPSRKGLKISLFSSTTCERLRG